MKAIHWGPALACALLALLGLALWVTVRAAPLGAPLNASLSAQASIDQAGLVLTATVGLDPNTCATGGAVRVLANTPVFHCYTVRNSGSVTLTLHQVWTARQGVITTSYPLNLPPGAITNTVRTGLRVADSSGVNVSNVVTWTARTATNISPTAIITVNAFSTIDVVNPNLSVVKSVGQDRNSCPSATSLRIPSGERVTFCITLENRGDITLTSHTISDPQQGINGIFSSPLPPNARLQILPATLSSLGLNGSLESRPITSLTTNVVNVTSRTAENLSVSRVATASVDVGSTTVIFTKTVSTSPVGCPGATTIVAPSGSRLFYCASIFNNGVVTLTHHRLIERFLSIDVEFDYVLPPGAKLDVTNDTLAQFNQPIVFGPFEFSERFANVVNNTMFYTGTSPAGFQVGTNASTSASFPPPPTPTRTPTPRTPSTPTITPTFTPSSTPIPLPPTFTPIPTPTPIIPTPTPTRSYAISLLETPTPRTQAAGLPVAPEQLPAPQQQFPVDDPVAATATQFVIDATATVAAAIAASLQASQDNAAATQTVAAGGVFVPASPLATPAVDASAIDPVTGLPVAPGFATPVLPTPLPTPEILPTLPVETATSIPLPVVETPTLPATNPPDAAQATPVPAPATDTPGVLVIVVTNTPGPPGAAGPLDPRRPIVYPTPTATADALLFVARTMDAMVATAGWIWFLAGSLIFFVTAGIVAGLFFRQADAQRYDLRDQEPDAWPTPEDALPGQAGRAAPIPEDEWPENLP